MMCMEQIPYTAYQVGRILEPLCEFWEHWGFEPWEYGPFAGVARRQRFVKDGFLGKIAEYRAWDYIIWCSGKAEDRETLWESITPIPEILTQRFLFLLDEPWTKRRIKSFFLGFKGYAEFHAYRPLPGGGIGCGDVKDLTDLVEMGIRLNETGHAAKNAGTPQHDRVA